MKIPFVNSPLRWIFFIGIMTALVLWLALVIMNTFFPVTNEDLSLDQNLLPSNLVVLQETYPGAYQFIESYFDQIQRGNYASLALSYWVNGVEAEILASCADPLADKSEGAVDSSKLWSHCGYFRGVTVEIINIVQTDSGFIATIQFINQAGDIVGGETNPELVRGHQLTITKTTDGGLRTPDWQFITL